MKQGEQCMEKRPISTVLSVYAHLLLRQVRSTLRVLAKQPHRDAIAQRTQTALIKIQTAFGLLSSHYLGYAPVSNGGNLVSTFNAFSTS